VTLSENKKLSRTTLLSKNYILLPGYGELSLRMVSQPSSVNAERKNSIIAPATLLVDKESALLLLGLLVLKTSFIAVC